MKKILPHSWSDRRFTVSLNLLRGRISRLRFSMGNSHTSAIPRPLHRPLALAGAEQCSAKPPLTLRDLRSLATVWLGAFAHAALLLPTVMASGLALANPNIPPPPQSKPLLITGATLHTISGDVISNGRMLVDKGRIVAIGAASAVPDTANATVLSLAGKHVYPGFIAANTTLGLVEVQSVRATVDSAEVGTFNPNSRALVAVNADSELIPVTRANGVLAALAAPRPGAASLIAGTSAVIQLDGWNWEDMGVAAEVGLHISLPSMRTNLSSSVFAPPTAVTGSAREEMERLTNQRLRALEDVFEAAGAYHRTRSVEPATPIDMRWEAMRPVFLNANAADKQRPVFVYADELPQIRYALAFAERFNLKLVVIGGQDAWRIASLLAERKVPVIIGSVHRLPLRRDDDVDAPFKLAATLHAAGVRFAIARGGSTFDAAMERSLPYEAGTAAAYGLPRAEALKAITLYPAQILGVADKLGSLEVGKLANFFVSDGDPLDIRSNVERIYIGGRELPLEDKQTRLNKKYEQKYQQLDVKRAGSTK
jgi:imidazolonepropionase-like amidohydrolase